MSTLPAVDALLALDAATLEALRKRFAAAGLLPNVEPLVRASAGVHPLMRTPMLRYHARKVKEPYGALARAFMFADPVSRAELDAALGELVGPVLDAGLLHEIDAGFVSPFTMALVSGLFLFADELWRGGEAVMGLGPSTNSLLAAAMPQKRVEAALDLGCGAGAIALVLARKAKTVVASDINPRAIALTRFNAALNGVPNIELCEGDLFAPVSGRRFDLIASQPPFIPQAEDGKSGTFMRGGARGDELPLAVLSKLAEHLTPQGRAVLFIEWALGPKIPSPVDRIQEALRGARLDGLLFQMPPGSADLHAVEYAAALHQDLGPAFERELWARRDHLATLGIEAMLPLLCCFAAISGRTGRLDMLPCGPLSRIAPNSKRIDKLLRGREVVDTLDGLLGAKLRMVEGVTLREEQDGPGMNVESQITAVLPPQAMTEPLRLSPLLLRLGTVIHEAPSVRAGVEVYHSKFGNKETAQEVLATVRNAVLTGLLEVAD